MRTAKNTASAFDPGQIADSPNGHGAVAGVAGSGTGRYPRVTRRCKPLISLDLETPFRQAT